MAVVLLAASLMSASLVVLPAERADAQQTPSGTAVVQELVRNADGSFTVPFDWALKPAGVGEGEVFRLLFITEDMRDATATDIADYDTFVQDAAGEGHTAIRPYADEFRVVGSTAAVDARTHTRTDPNRDWDAPIWWVNGKRVAANNERFWSSTWENWALSDRRYETGEADAGNDWPWTGTQTDGTKHTTDPLGSSPNVSRGRYWTGSGDTGPIDYNRAAATEDHSLYGMSPRFKVGTTRFADPAPGGPVSLSNLGEADGAARALSSSAGLPSLAQSFQTGANGGHYRLRSVDIEFATSSDVSSTLQVHIMADSGGNPDTDRVLATLTNPPLTVSSSDRTYTFTYAGDGPGLKLEAATTYWVMVDALIEDTHGVFSVRGTASDAERLQGLPEGWRIGDGSRHQIKAPIPATGWSAHSEALKIGLNLGAAEPFVQFRTCEGTVSGNSCSTGWVVFNYNRHGPTPTITLAEGGEPVTYQWRAVDPWQRRYLHVADQVELPHRLFRSRSNAGSQSVLTFRDYRIGPGGTDRDRLICHTGLSHSGPLGDPVGDWNTGSSAGTGLDRHSGCPFATQFIAEHDPNKWRPVTVAAGHDSDAFDHYTALHHHPYSVGHNFYENGVLHRAVGFDYPSATVNLVIRDDDEWEQDLVFSVDDGTTWTSLEDGGLSLAFPPSLNTGKRAHRFWVRLKNDPATLGNPSQTKRFSIIARYPSPLIDRGTHEEWLSWKVSLSSPAADHLHSFPNPPDTGASGSVTVSYTPIQVEINVGDNVVGTVLYDWEATSLYERNDNQISTATPPATVRTESFSLRGLAGSCVGCQLLPGDLPDPVVERIGELSFANLSDTGIDLSWPLVVGAEGYEVRYWSTVSPFAGDPNVPPHRPEDVYTGAEPSEPRWNIRHLEPDTEYRAQVFYKDHGATQLSTASPVIRFTTLSAGSPVQAEPTSVVVERVPEASISAAAGTITEGGDATFTVTVEPAPDAPMDVQVHVIAPSAGAVIDGTHLGTRTVTVPTSGSATFTIPTVDDARWDSNGMLGAGVQFGEGYRQSTFKSYASVYIANNDLPPPPPVQIKGVADTTATVAWKPQAEGAQYMVVWHKSVKGIPVLQEITTTETEYQITGLDPNSRYTVAVLAGTTHVGKLWVTTLAAGTTPQTFTVDFETPAPSTSLPVVSVTSDGDVTEGSDATFTVTANPAPAADLDVSVTVSADGDHGATAGQRTVTIPAAGYITLTVATTDDQDDEADGTVTVSIDPDPDGYLVSTSQHAATVAVADDDDGPAHTVAPDVIARVRALAAQTQHGTAHVNRWNRVLVAFGTHDGTGVTGGAMTAAQAQQMADTHSSPVWDEVVAELTKLEAAPQQTPPPPPPTPEVSITAAAGGTEGDPVTFTVTASPAPVADLAVSLTVATSGDFGFGALPASVTIPTSGSATVTITTTDDAVDEADGSVTLALNAGSGYTVGALSSQTATVADDDDPPVAVPVVSITGSVGATEGQPVTFTLTASPAPAAGLPVSVTVSAVGDHGVSTGSQTVTIPASGSATVTIATVGDAADEADGSVTLTLNAGDGYTVGALSSQTATVADDDDPPPPPPPPVQDEPDDAVLADCGDEEPALSISSPTASRSDATVDFEVGLDCKPARSMPVLLVPVRDGDIGYNILVIFTGQQPTATVTVTVGSEHQLGLAVGWAPSIANREAQGTVTYAD